MLSTNDSSLAQSLGKAVLALSGASVVRTVRCGLGAGKKSLIDTYQTVDPFSEMERAKALMERIPCKPLTELVELPPALQLDLRWAEIDGSTPLKDIVSILALAVSQQPEAVLEFGTFFGSTSANLALNLPNAIIHTIDLPPDEAEAAKMIDGQPVDDRYLIKSRQLGKAFRGTSLESRIVQHTGDTARYDYSVISENVSFFLIDGSHTYEYAKSDTLNAFRLARGPATFTWHDCDEIHPGVTRWLGELMDAGLPVAKVEGTIVGCMKVDTTDPRVQQFLSAN